MNIIDKFVNGYRGRFNNGNVNWIIAEENERVYYVMYNAPCSPQQSEDDFAVALEMATTVTEFAALVGVSEMKYVPKSEWKPFSTSHWNLGYSSGCNYTDKNRWRKCKVA